MESLFCSMTAVIKVITMEDDCPLSKFLHLEILKKTRHGLLKNEPVEWHNDIKETWIYGPRRSQR